MSNDKKPTDEQRDDDSIMSDEELESVSGGCQWGNETSFPKLPDGTFKLPPITPMPITPIDPTIELL